MKQEVFAYVPVRGWISYTTDFLVHFGPGPPQAGGPGNTFVYTTMTQTLQVPGVGSRVITTQWDIFGNSTVADSNPTFDWNDLHGAHVSDAVISATELLQTFANGTITWDVANPYTFAQAVDNAKLLLAQVQLLNPVKTYNTPDFGIDGAQVHFGYGVEGYSPMISAIWVHWDHTGAVAFQSFNPFPTDQDSGFWFAMNGYGTGQLGLNLMVKKTAWLTQIGWVSRTSSVVTFNDPDATYGAPVTDADGHGPGENIFDPSDVPGFGMSVWNS